MNICNHITLHPNSLIYEHGMMREEVAFDQIIEIAVITTDEGPFVDDIFLVLKSAQGEVRIPSEAENFEELFEVFKKFKDFNYETYIEALSSTEYAKFICWQKVEI